MKNVILVILVILAIVSLSGCKPIIDYGVDCSLRDRYSNIPIYYGNFTFVNKEELIPYWMDFHVTYRKSDDLLSPEACVATGYGDCEEFALLYLNIMYVQFGKKGELCLVQSNRAIEAGGRDFNHAVVRYGSTIIEPMSGKVANYTVCYHYDFDEIFR